MSVEKCSTLYNAITNSGILPTNRAWLESLSDKDFSKEIKKRFDQSNWKGTNILGFALMDVRDIIKSRNG